MSGVGGIGAGGGGAIDRVMALRAQILERNEALQRAGSAGGASPVTSAPATKPASFAATLEDALQSVNAQQRQAGARFQIDPHGLCHDQGIRSHASPAQRTGTPLVPADRKSTRLNSSH